MKGTSVDHLAQPLCQSRVTYSRLHRTASRQVLNISWTHPKVLQESWLSSEFTFMTTLTLQQIIYMLTEFDDYCFSPLLLLSSFSCLSLPKKAHICHGFQKTSRLQQPKHMPDSAHHYSCKVKEHDIFTAVINTLISPKHWHYQKAFTVAKSKNACNPSIELSQRLFWELFRGKRFIRYATGYKNKANSSCHVRNKFVHGQNNSNTIIIATQASQRAFCHQNSLLYKTDQYAKNTKKGRQQRQPWTQEVG